MKKMTLFLAILIFSRIGIAYGADLAPNGLQNFFLGSTNASSANINQVLALLVGPEGPPGPAGVAGRDGFVGMNGVDGMPGAPGATGEAGPQGAQGVPGVQGLPGATGATGPQGVAGTTGATGGTGPQGPAGPAGGGPVLGYSGGALELRGCASTVQLKIERKFMADGFRLQGISVGSIPEKCVGQKLIVYAKSSTTVKCQKVIAAVGVTLIDSTASCVKESDGATVRDFFYQSETQTGTTINSLNPAIGVEITE
jgi:Collagen triple helix repeat (20 copies)